MKIRISTVKMSLTHAKCRVVRDSVFYGIKRPPVFIAASGRRKTINRPDAARQIMTLFIYRSTNELPCDNSNYLLLATNSNQNSASNRT